VGWILEATSGQIIEIVGIAEPNRARCRALTKNYGDSNGIGFDSLDENVSSQLNRSVTAFGNMLRHLAVVKPVQPKGIMSWWKNPWPSPWRHAR